MTNNNLEVQRVEYSIRANPSIDVLTPSQVDIIKSTIAKGVSDDELKLFLAVCARTGLDPFRREVYAIKRRSQNDEGQWVDTMVIQVGIDGMRAIAESSDEYAGQVGPEWCGPDGVWKDVWLSDEPPAAARVGVLRKGWPQPLWAVARWKTYAQTRKDGELTRFWKLMPDLMIAKCSEALALRRAFPHKLSGLYAPEEIREFDETELPKPSDRPALNGPSAPKARVVTATTAQMDKIKSLAAGWDKDALRDLLAREYPNALTERGWQPGNLSTLDARRLIADLEGAITTMVIE